MKIVHVTECLAGGVLTFLVNLTSQLDDDEHIIIYGKRDNTPADVQKMFGPNVSLIYWKNAQREIRPKQDFMALQELLRDLRKSSGALAWSAEKNLLFAAWRVIFPSGYQC